MTRPSNSSGGRFPGEASLPIVIATILREDGITGVDTHVRQLRRYLAGCGTPATLVTPFSWGRALTYPVFGLRLVLERCSRPASVAWYLHWHEMFLRHALRRRLAGIGDCVVYAQDPFAARAALARAARATPARGHGGSLPDLQGRRVGRQEADQARRDRLPGHPDRWNER